MRMRSNQGFTLIELMVVIAIVGVLAGVAVPMFMAHASNAKATEATLQLEKIARNASLYFAEHRAFPQGVAAVLPGADGSACSQADRLLPVSDGWGDDPAWAAFDMVIGEKTRFSYHYQATSKKSAHVWAVADFNCNGKLVVYDLYLEGRSSGHVEHAIIDPLSKRKASRPVVEVDGDDADTDSTSSDGSSASGAGTSSSSSASSSSGNTGSSSGSTGTSSGSTGSSSGSTGTSSGSTGSSSGGTGTSGSSSSSSGSSTSSGGSSSTGTTTTSGGGTTVTVGGSTTTTVCIENGNSGTCKKTK